MLKGPFTDRVGAPLGHRREESTPTDRNPPPTAHKPVYAVARPPAALPARARRVIVIRPPAADAPVGVLAVLLLLALSLGVFLGWSLAEVIR